MSSAVLIFLLQGVLLMTLRADDQVRLVSDGSIASQGRVEVLHKGEWGTLCDTEWDLEDANIVCRQLGYDGAIAAPKMAAFGEGTGKIWMDNVKCAGNESVITDCENDGWEVALLCSHKNDASAVCNPRVRLVRGPSGRVGLVQVYHNNTWGWVCDDQWNKQDADVVCRELGYTSSSEFYTSISIDDSKGTKWLNNPRCAGIENTLFSCKHDGWGSRSCLKNENTGVRCIAPQVRLSGGDFTFYGRVEIYFSGLWGTVSDDWWSLTSASVVCRQLGFDGAVAARPWSAFGEGKGVIWMNNVQCKGDESSIADCFFNGWGIDTPLFHHYHDASVVCQQPVRLVNGPSLREGLVQVYFNHTWGWVCDDKWSRQDSDVVCRMMGYTGSYPSVGHVNLDNNITTWLNNVRCAGNEISLFLCAHDGWRRQRCPDNKQATVVCTGPEVRLFNNIGSPYRGRVEVLYNGIWGTVCNFHWDVRDANVACRHLGYDKAEAASDPLQKTKSALERLSRTINLGGAIWLGYIQCVGSEFSLSACRHSGWGQDYCNHIQDASVICSDQVASVAKPRMISSGLQSISLQWNPSKGTKNYRVQIRGNNSLDWEETLCYGSMAVRSCLVEGNMATVKELQPSSVYFFRIQPAGGPASLRSDAMETRSLAIPDRPFFKEHTSSTITVGWKPLLLKSIVYKLEVKLDQTTEWREAVCVASIFPGRCIVQEPYAKVTGLNGFAIYQFRVYAILRSGAESDPSMPSVGLSPRGGQDLPRIDLNVSSNTISCDRLSKCTLFCYASSEGPVRYTWTKDGKSLNSSDVIVINNILVISPRSKEDYGLYVCRAKNEAGGVELEMKVTENRSSVPFSTIKEIKGEGRRKLPLLPAVIVLCFALFIVSVVIFWLKWRKRITKNREQKTEMQTPFPIEDAPNSSEEPEPYASHEYQKLESINVLYAGKLDMSYEEI